MQREAEDSGDGGHDEQVHDRRGRLADLEGHLVIHGLVAHAPREDHGLGPPTDHAGQRADHAEDRIAALDRLRCRRPARRDDGREGDQQGRDLAGSHALLQEDES